MHGVHGSAADLSERDKAALTAGRYGSQYAIMREMGWSWRDLCEAPADLVQEILIRLSAEREWTEKKYARDAQMTRGKREH